MKRNPALTILAICITITVILFAMADKPFQYRQHFTRIHRNHALVQENVIPVKLGSYVAGITPNQFYLANENEPLVLTHADYDLRNPDTLQLILPNVPTDSLGETYLEVHYPIIYIKAGQLPGIFRCDIQGDACVLLETPYFQRGSVIGSTTFALQTQGSTQGSATKHNLLWLVSPTPSNKKVMELSNDVSGYFTSQGILRYSHTLGRLVYVHHYHNKILVMDTALNLLYKGTTLDTITQPALKPHEVSEGRFSLASTRAVVNLNAQVDNTILYIHSNLMAVNDTRSVFDFASVIDVYDLNTLNYTYSFYIPDYEGEKMITFRVAGNRLITVYPNYLVVYAFSRAMARSK